MFRAWANRETIETLLTLGKDLVAQMKDWFKENGFYYLASSVVHAFCFVCIALISICIPVAWQGLTDAETPAEIDSAMLVDDVPAPLDRFEVGDAPLNATELNAHTLLQTMAPGQEAIYFDDSPDFAEGGGGTPNAAKGPLLGGMGVFDLQGLAGIGGLGGVGASDGFGEFMGTGGDAMGFDSRGEGHRDALAGALGGTHATERAVGAALNWLFRHQNTAGNWSLQFTQHCSGRACSGQGQEKKADAAATGLALLPFLGAGQTHKSRGPYRQAINKGIAWLIKNQESDGNLAAGMVEKPMYAHGIATIALCEAYGMTRDEYVGIPARRAIAFIEQAQNKRTGGWRYKPGDSGDTSVLGWQVMALKSAQLAGLGVDTNGIEGVRRWLNSVAKGEHEGLFSYVPYQDATPTMTAVGQLCYQYLGSNRDDPRMIEGKDYLMKNPPDNSSTRNSYYWYYATMVMHNFLGPDWDAWNRQMRRVLIEAQEKEDCATGSWDPENPTSDTWGPQGGRLMTTCFAALTLEVYYRYLPLFQFRSPEGAASESKKAAPKEKAEPMIRLIP
jgi:hypothetical protein